MPAHAFEPDAAFDKRGLVGERRKPLGSGDRKRLEPPLLDERRHRHGIEQPHRDRAGKDVGHRLHAALVRNVRHLHAAQLFDRLAHKVRRGPVAERGEAHLVALPLRQRYEVAKRIEGAVRPREQDQRHDRNLADSDEILRRVIAGLLQYRRTDDEAGCRNQDRMPVGRAAPDLCRAERTARTGLVFHYHGLAEVFAQGFGEKTGHDVGPPAGRIGNQKPDRSGGKSLRARGAGGERQERGNHYPGQPENGAHVSLHAR